MMNPTLDLQRPHTTVGGRNPLYYIQNGHGFNRAGEYLGEFDAQGEPTGKAPVQNAGKSADESEAERKAAEELARIEQEAQAKAAAEKAGPEAAYKGVKAATMKTMCEQRGLDFEPSADRDALLAILIADDKAKASA